MKAQWEIERDERNKAIDKALSEFALEYKAEFIPQSKSRNSAEKRATLNWRITIKRGSQVLTTDYTQGIAHCPDYQHFENEGGHKEQWYKRVAETGRYTKKRLKLPNGNTDWWGMLNSPFFGSSLKALPVPPLRDVLYSLVRDSDVLDYPTYEEWANNFGFDEDSRKAEATYRACLEIALKMRGIFGESGLEELRELFQDY